MLVITFSLSLPALYPKFCTRISTAFRSFIKISLFSILLLSVSFDSIWIILFVSTSSLNFGIYLLSFETALSLLRTLLAFSWLQFLEFTVKGFGKGDEYCFFWFETTILRFKSLRSESKEKSWTQYNISSFWLSDC